MRDGNIVVFTLRSLLGEICGKGGIPQADIFGGIEDGVAQVSGASFLHMGIAVFELAGLVGRWRKPGVGQQFIRRLEPGEVTSLGKYHGSHAVTNAWDGRNRRMYLIHNGLDFRFNFFNLGVQFPYEMDGMSQFQRLPVTTGTTTTIGCMR